LLAALAAFRNPPLYVNRRRSDPVLVFYHQTRCANSVGRRAAADPGAEIPDRQRSNHDPLDLVEAQLIVAAIIELGGARR